MHSPAAPPIGLYVAQVSKVVSRAFDECLAAEGGSLPVWHVLVALTDGHAASQRELAEQVGIQDATLTHHLNAMEAARLVTRRRDPRNRRVHLVELTTEGEALHARLREAAAAFDGRLRGGFTDDELTRLRELLTRLRDNAV